MTYQGKVRNGVVIFDGPQRPPEGAVVRINEFTQPDEVGDALDRLAGQAQGLPHDLAERHDHYRKIPHQS